MVKMYIMKCLNDLDGFDKDTYYPARKSKSGQTFIRNNYDEWQQFEGFKLSLSQDSLKSNFKISHEFSVPNHKFAVNFSLR